MSHPEGDCSPFGRRVTVGSPGGGFRGVGITQPQNSAAMTSRAGSGLASGADMVATRLMQFSAALFR